MAYPPMSAFDHGLTDALVGIRDPESAEVKNGVTGKPLPSLNVYHHSFCREVGPQILLAP
jgi:hypothetical protein